MLSDEIERTALAEGRLTRSELFNELAKMHKRLLPRPGLKTEDREAIHRNEALEVRLPRVPARAAATTAKEIPIEA